MQTYSQTIGAGATLQFNTPGTFFRLLTTSGPVTVVYYRRGAEVARAEGMEAGYGEEMPDGFDNLTIYSATSQAIKWAVRNGGSMRYDRSVGSVDITNTGGDLTNTAKTVTSTSANLVSANAARRYLLIQNKDNAGSIWVAFGAVTVTQTLGVRIGPGGSLCFENYVPRNEVRAIGDAASNANIIVVEG